MATSQPDYRRCLNTKRCKRTRARVCQPAVPRAHSHGRKCFVKSCGCTVSFLSLSQSEPHLIQRAAHIPAQHAIPLAKAPAGPQGQLGRIYPFILQDTHTWQSDGSLTELYRKVTFPRDNHLLAWSFFVWLEFLGRNVNKNKSCSSGHTWAWFLNSSSGCFVCWENMQNLISEHLESHHISHVEATRKIFWFKIKKT